MTMKTLKQFRAETEERLLNNICENFGIAPSKKMGGIVTVEFRGETHQDDRREYYTGRGAKYNNNSMHDNTHAVVTEKMFNERVARDARISFNYEKEMKAVRKQRKLEALESKATLNALGLDEKLFRACDNEFSFNYADKSAVEKALGVDLTDFFASEGKTYYFENGMRFFHNHRQSYSFAYEQLDTNRFNDSWRTRPYSGWQNENLNNKNLFVC